MNKQVSDAGKQVSAFLDTFKHITEEIRKDIVGQDQVVQNMVIALIAGGNVLLEGVPGTGKTRLVRSIGQAVNLSFSRIQFLPDLMPADVTGTMVMERQPDGTARFVFQKGPVFANIVLADEINRATPKTQSALLEVMQEHTVTVSGENYPLEEPFFVLATQNPIEQEGTYALPEAQIDRFMMKLDMTFPSREALKNIVTLTEATQEIHACAVCSRPELLAMRALAVTVPVADDVMDLAVSLVEATHQEVRNAPAITKKYLRIGASPRAAQALVLAARVHALARGAYHVSREDIAEMAYPVLRHRIRLNFDAVTENRTADELIEAILKEIQPKRSFFAR